MSNLFGKRARGEINNGRKKFSPKLSTVPKFKNKILLDYIISHAENDQRPYLQVTILGYPILGLLDSGATSTVVGKVGYDTLLQLGLTLNTKQVTDCTVANGQICPSVGTMAVPFCLMGRVCVIDVLVVPNLRHSLVLGSDFWIAMGIVPDLRRDVWHFSSVEDCKEICVINDESDLTMEQRLALDKLVAEKFTLMGTSLGITNLGEHEIITDSPPIKQRYYPVSPAKQKLIDQELNEMLKQDIIEPSSSGWSSPILLVPKKDGKYRFCVDFRKLNSVTKKDAYPIPYMSAILDRLRNAKYLSSIDIKSAYWQVPVSQSSREYTAFTIPGRGLYHFKKMPFGLTNAPATWQRILDRALGADLEPYVLVYLDDIVVVSPDFSTHLRILEQVFDRLHAAGLTVNKDKCQFCRPQLHYLGYVVDKRGLHVDPQKVDAILKVPIPSNIGEIRRFVGMTSYYRKFIPNFADIIAPLTQLTKKNAKFVWSSTCDESFRRIKELLVTAPILNCPDFEKPFTLHTDASDYGVGAVLTQDIDGEKVISFLSRSLTKSERKYSTTERELISVIWAVEKLRHYLEGTRFTIVTDHHSLLWLDRLRDPTGRLARWALRLQAFDYTVVHRKGKHNVVPDFLSRSVPMDISTLDFGDGVDAWYQKMLQRVTDYPELYPKWRSENNILYKYVKRNLPELADEADNWKVVVPRNKRKELLKSHHDDPKCGHGGIFKTYWRLHNKYTWPKMRADVVKYVKSCNICAQHKPEQKAPAGVMGKRPSIDKPWQMISLDFVGPLPRSTRGYAYILVVTDFFSKYVVLIPLRSITSKALSTHVEEDIFLVYGVPQTIICDNGKQMIGKEFRSMCQKYNTRIFYTPLYHPSSDPTERTNRIVKTMLASYVHDNQRKWDLYLPSVGCAIRTSKHETTGYSPFCVNFGREYVSCGDQYDMRVNIPPSTDAGTELVARRLEGFRKMYFDVRQRILKAHLRNKHYYDLRRRPVKYEPGQLVWRKNKSLSSAVDYYNAKLGAKYVGPYKVRKKLGTCSYELEDDTGHSKGVWHVQDIKPVYNPEED